ncbi:MAG: ABC transporter permease, partial [Candidatus Hodarchaeales archaeon]
MMLFKSLIYSVRCIKQTIRNYERVGVILIVPILFITGMAFLYGEESSFVIVGDSGNEFKIGVVNNDQTIQLPTSAEDQFRENIEFTNIIGDPLLDGFGKTLIDNINRTSSLFSENERRIFHIFPYSDIESAGKAVQSRFITLCFVIPSDFSKTLLAGLNHRINITSNVKILNSSEFYFSGSNIELIGDYSYSRFLEASILLEEAITSFTDLFWVNYLNDINLEVNSISNLTFREFDIFIPALLVFVLITSSTGVTGIIGFEKENGTIDRLKLSGYASSNILIGATMTQILTTLLTMIVTIATIILLGFPIQNYQQILTILGACFLGVLPLLGISLGVAVITDGQTATYLPSMIAIPLSFLTGNFIPLPRITLISDIQLWHINPFYSIGEILRKSMILNLTYSDFLVDISSLILSGSFIFLMGAM